MKLSEIENEKALDVLADILEPASKILSTPEVKEAFEGGANPLLVCKSILKTNKKEIIEILAALDGENPDTYKINVLSLPTRIIEILNDKELVDFFTSQSQTE